VNVEILRFQLRRERILLPVWLLGVAALFTASGLAVTREFGDEQQRAAVVALAAGNPAFLFLRGLPDGIGAGALAFFQTFSFLAVLIALMNVFLITRHTRGEENSGRSELLQATPIARSTTLASVLTIAMGANLGAAMLTAGAGMAIGLDAGGAILTGLALAAVGLAFAGIAALSAQIMPTSRGANGLGAAAVGIAYVIRGVGDALGTATGSTQVTASWVSFLSPIGWAQHARPFSEASPWPLVMPLLLGTITATVATLMRRRRDLGESIIRVRPGRPRWTGADAWRLAIRTQIGTTIGWSIATVILGLLAGLLSPFVLEAVGANDDLAALLHRLAPDLAVDTGELFAIALLGISATLATAAGVQAVMRLRSDEAEGRAEIMLTARMPRSGWFMRQLATAVVSMLTVSVVAGLAAGAGFVLSSGDSSRIATSLATIAAHLPAGTVFIAVTALAFALTPRLTAAFGWGLLALGLIVGQLGDLIGLPAWIQDISPFRHVPAVPLESPDLGSSLIMLAAAAVIVIAAAGIFRARDVPA
jgi:ABC-2 type transport system permease protein